MQFDMKIILLAIAIAPYLGLVSCLNCSDVKFQCQSKTTCRECIREHYCCHWCYSEKDPLVRRCNTMDELQGVCGGKIEENFNSKATIKLDHEFTEISNGHTNFDSIVQLKPQEFDVVLRKGTPVNLTFTYKTPKNYPLDMYYLGDLSYSMLSHLDTLKGLGEDLSHSLRKLTENYRLAYGSFMDKPAMPFYYTDPINIKNPCRFQHMTCEPGYLFKHWLDFTSKMENFFEEVQKSNITANVDNLDGALDAIFQLLVCKNRIRWSKSSRKLIFLATDSFLHTAGDGLLAGSVRKNPGECMIDSSGDFTDPLKYDYPDLGEILRLLQKNRVNIIVATKDDKTEYYSRLKKDILKDHIFIGELQENATNILDVVESGFTNFVKQVQYSVNATEVEELDVQFFGSCSGEDFNETSSCYNVREGEPVTFKVQLTLKGDTLKTRNVIFVKEKNVNEEIKINLEYVGFSCSCPSYLRQNVTCEHGISECGECYCDMGWTGVSCSEECDEDYSSCRTELEDGSISSSCNGRGSCICGKCECDSPYVGKYCDYACPVNKDTRKVCSGEDHGKCVEGLCICEEAYKGEDCTCETSMENCKLTANGTLCNNKGKCECNRCVCDEEFEGKYCEETAEGNVFCTKYDALVQDYAENKTTSFNKDGIEIVIKDEVIKCESPCQVITYAGTSRCYTQYCYERSGDDIHLHLVDGSCTLSAAVFSTGIGLGLFLAILLLGLAIIALKKYRNHAADVAEYKKFERERERSMLHNNQNPLYNSPMRQYTNPLSGRYGTEAETENL